MSQDAINRVTRAVSGFDARVQATPESAWMNQSPCEEWKARDIVAHVTNNLRRVCAGLGGAARPEVGPDDDIRTQWSETRDAFVSAASTADMSAMINGPFGPMPAEEFLAGIITSDTLVHTWDLARSVGADESLDADLVEGAYAGLKPLDAMIRRPGIFGDKIEALPTADRQTEFLSFLGRRA